MLGEPKTTLDFLEILFSKMWSEKSKTVYAKGNEIGPQFSCLNSGNKFVP